MTAPAPIGIAQGYDPSLTVRQQSENAARAEQRGFSMAFFSETLFTNRDSMTALTAFAACTERIGLGATQVVKLRSPLVMAQSIASLDEFSGGRLSIVLGAYTAKHAARNGIPLTDPIPTLREYVESVRALLRGETIRLDGETMTLDGAVLNFAALRPEPPIWIAATTRKGLLNAGAIGDGILLDAGASPAYAANAIALVRQGALDAGRDPAAIDVAQLINTSIEDDRASAIEAMRWEVASKFTYASTPKAKLTVGEPVIDRSDLPHLERAFTEGGKEALAAAIPERYVTGLTATGTVDEVRARVQQYRDAGVTLPLVRPARLAQLDRLLDTFGADPV